MECASKRMSNNSMEATFKLPDDDPGLCNAIRRSLLSDITMWAPKEVAFRCNTTWQTDEYIAHRVGLIPFRRVGNVDSMELKLQGPGVARASDITGPGFEAIQGDIEIMTLPSSEQKLDLTIHFDEQKASKHARYSKCCAVGMRKDGAVHKLSFGTIDGSRPIDALLEAVNALDVRVQNALISLANQPSTLPESV